MMSEYHGPIEGVFDDMSPRPLPKWNRVRTFWPKTCSVTDKRIPMFTMAYYRATTFGDFDVGDSIDWMSAESYTFKKLKDEVQ